MYVFNLGLEFLPTSLVADKTTFLLFEVEKNGSFFEDITERFFVHILGQKNRFRSLVF